MATPKENTLQLKDFMGISRYYNSANQPPNKLYTCQNTYSPTKGELALIGGVTDASGAGFPGATALKGVHFLKTSIGYERALVFFDHAALPTPSAPTAVPVTGTGFTGNIDVKIAYVGMGGESTLSAATTVACGAGKNIQVTVPSLPAGIVGINIYNNDTIIGTVSKRGGSVPATVTVTKSPPAVTGDSEKRITVTGFTVSFATGGTLTAGRTYYFGIAPAAGDMNVTTRVGQATLPTVTNPTGKIFSFTVPEGFSAASISLTGARVEMQNTSTLPLDWDAQSPAATPNIWLFVGTTPEDMLAVSGNTDGFVQSFSWGANLLINELPYNSNFGTYKQGAWYLRNDDYSDAYNLVRLRACQIGGDDGVNGNWFNYENNASGLAATSDYFTSKSGLGIWAMAGTSFNATTDYQILPVRGSGVYSRNTSLFGGIGSSLASVFIPYSGGQFVVNEGNGIRSAAYVNRLYFANGLQCPFYTNGYIVKQAPRKPNAPYLPITNEIAVFKDRLVLGGGTGSMFNTQNVVYYSATADFETFTGATAATAALQYVSAIDADSDSIVGFGVYSESINQYGNQGFLVIGKGQQVYTWTGDTTQGAQPIVSKAGFASAKCFCIMPIGPVFVGRDNVYHLSIGGKATKIGNDVEDILKNLTDDQIQSVTAVVHESHMKIGYKTGTNVDREIWLDIRAEEGQLIPVFTGPHQMKDYTGHVATDSFAGSRNVRLSYLSTKVYRRDDYSSYLNDGSNIAVYLETNDMGLGTDEFSKLLTRFYLRAKVKRTESVTLTVGTYDNKEAGTSLDYTTDGADQSFTESMSLPYGGSGTTYRLFQKLFASRYRGSIIRFGLSLSTNVEFKIQALSWLYNIHRRRQL